MKKLFCFLLLLVVAVVGFSQATGPFPNYQHQGSPTTRWTQQGAVQGMKGIINGVFTDTLTCNNTTYIDFYPGAQIFTTLDSTLWLRNTTATRWMRSSSGAGSITSFTMITDSSVRICFGDGTCDTLAFNNFSTTVNTLIQNFNDSTVYNINDSTLIICPVAGACDTINLGNSNTYSFLFDTTLNSFFLVTCDTAQSICVGDSCYLQQVCDTIAIPRPPGLVFQSGVRRIPGTPIVQHGQPFDGAGYGSLIEDTWLYTDFQQYVIKGRPLNRQVLKIDHSNWSQVSSSISSWNHYGAYRPGWGLRDENNPVNLYVNYTNPFTIPSNGPFQNDTIGFMGDRYGYMLMTNARGHHFSYAVDDVNAKQVGIFFDTYTDNDEGVSIFAQKVPAGYLLNGNPASDSTFLDQRVAIFKTNHDVQLPNYPSTRNDGGTSKVLYTDIDGNVKLGPVNGGDVITIINDTTINICSFGTNLCDTIIINNIGVIQTVSIINDSTIVVCDSVGVCDTLIVNPTVFAQPITANNGLIMSTPTNVQLGSPVAPGAPLLHVTHIDATSLYQLNINGSISGTNWVFSANNTGTGAGVYGTALSGNAVAGAATSGVGGAFRATSGIGITASSVSSFAGMFNIRPATTNTVASVIQLQRQTSGTAANGIGTKIEFASQTTDGTLWQSSEIISKWTTATTASRVSQYILTGVNNAIPADLHTVYGTGQHQFNKYGVGTFSGTPAYALATDASGNIIEFPPGGIVGGILTNANNGLSIASSTVVQLGQSIGAGGNPAALLSNREIPMANFTLNFNADASQSNNMTVWKNSSAAVRATVTAAAEFSNTGGQTNSEQFGAGALASGGQQVIIGRLALGGTGTSNTVVGYNSSVANSLNSVTLIGSSITHTTSGFTTLVGAATTSSGRSTGFGSQGTYSGTNNFGFGEQVNVSHTYSGAIGFGATTTANNQLVLGDNVNSGTEGGINDIYFGEGVLSEAPNNVSITPNGGVGTNIAGSSFSINGSPATGNALGGPILFKTSDVGASGTTPQTLTEKVGINSNTKGLYLTNERFQEYEGTSVAAANDLTLGRGNLFTISGATQINAITSTNWQDGATIGLIFTGAPLVKHNTAGGAGTATMLLAGSVDFQAAAGDNIEFRYDGTNFHEIGRTVAAGQAMGARNGLSVVGSFVELGSSSNPGSALLHDSYINSTASYSLVINGSADSYITVPLIVQNTNNGNALQVVTTGGAGDKAPILTQTNGTSAAVLRGLDVYNGTTAADGMGIGIQFKNRTSTSVGASDNSISNQIISKWTTSANATRTSQFIITGLTSGTIQDWLTVGQSGYVKFRPMTVTEAGAITTAEGLMVFVSNTDATFTSIGLWIFQNGAWKAL